MSKPARFPEKTILIVDDELELVSILEGDLAPIAGRILTSRSGREAIEVVTRESVDLVLSDVRMAEGGGRDVLLHLRGIGSGEPARRVPSLIFLSAFSDISPDEALDLGALAVFSKPYDPEMLVESVVRALRDPEARWATLGEEALRAASPGLVVDAPERETGMRWGSGGIFVPGNHGELEVHDEIVVEVRPSNTPRAALEACLRGLAQVRWIRRFPTADLPAGIGLEWIALGSDLRDVVLKFREGARPTSFIPRR